MPEPYNEQAELDAVYCDICGHHHSPDCASSQGDDSDDDDGATYVSWASAEAVMNESRSH
jgi:hypothetical protein